jgi:hypothetical protein
MLRVRSNDKPAEVIVAICRLMIARSLSPMPLLRPGILISMLSPVPTATSVTEIGDSPMVRTRVVATLSDGASTRPLTTLPAALRPL